MSINFTPQRWDKIRQDYDSWWAGKLERPLIRSVISGQDPKRGEPKLADHKCVPFFEEADSAEDIVDCWDYNLSCCKFLGDSFPFVWPDFGAGVIAALLGCRLEAQPSGNTVWFHPPKQQEIKDIDLQYDPNNKWINRIKDIMRAAVDKWAGSVQIGMTDLGGNLDILSSFRPSEELLFDLYDYPDEVKRLTWQAHDLWLRYFNEFSEILQKGNAGFTPHWVPIFSTKPVYMLQCDFCYMISPEMFDEFVKPELAAMCDKIDNAFYHLDGPGELPHLDSLLEIEQLAGVQWIPGSGNPHITEWPEVFKKIRDAGKLIQFFGNLNDLDIVADQLGSAKGIILIGADGGPEDEEGIMAGLEKYGAE